MDTVGISCRSSNPGIRRPCHHRTVDGFSPSTPTVFRQGFLSDAFRLSGRAKLAPCLFFRRFPTTFAPDGSCRHAISASCLVSAFDHSLGQNHHVWRHQPQSASAGDLSLAAGCRRSCGPQSHFDSDSLSSGPGSGRLPHRIRGWTFHEAAAAAVRGHHTSPLTHNFQAMALLTTAWILKVLIE